MSAATVEILAKSVLSLAGDSNMPDTYWWIDSRILKACDVLGWKVEKAQRWAQSHPNFNTRTS